MPVSGRAWRFRFTARDKSEVSFRLDPSTTCPYLLLLTKWPVQAVSDSTKKKLVDVMKRPFESLNLEPIPKLLEATEDRPVNIMGVVVSIGRFETSWAVREFTNLARVSGRFRLNVLSAPVHRR